MLTSYWLDCLKITFSFGNAGATIHHAKDPKIGYVSIQNEIGKADQLAKPKCVTTKKQYPRCFGFFRVLPGKAFPQKMLIEAEDNIIMRDSQNNSNILSILLVDRLPTRRSGVALLLERWAETDGISIRMVETLDRVGEMDGPFDLTLLSIGGTPAAAPEVQALIIGSMTRADSMPVAVLADDDDALNVIAAVRAGARGYISQRIEPGIMFRALKFIASGGVFFPPEALLRAGAIADTSGIAPIRVDPNPAHLSAALTCRQGDVLQLLLRGLTNKCIARELQMRESTVKVHVRQIMRKLGASNRTQAALFARQGDGGTAARAQPPSA